MTTAEHRRWPRRPRRTMGSIIAVAAVSAMPACGTSTGASTSDRKVESITVAAASDLRPAFEELGSLFEAATSTKVIFSFGSSGQLREQILNGAPFHLFASANAAFVDEVIDAGRGIESTKADYALGRIALFTSPGVALPADIGELTDARFRRIAIANPEHAPYGQAAQQALESAGVYEAVKARLVYGENISDAFRIAESGNAEVGIVALSLAIADGGDYTLVPSELHEPLQQALVITATGPAGDAASAFAAFVGSPEGREVMIRYGFVLPGDPTPGS